MISKNQNIFNQYFTHSHYDEMLNNDLEIKTPWRLLYKNLQGMGPDELSRRQTDLNWYLAENGVTYNVYNDPHGLNRPWNLNVFPTIITSEEWAVVKKGIKQRAELFNLILQDLYGPRHLIREGIVPLEVIYSHRGFLRACDQIEFALAQHLLIYAADLARGPDGRFWVIGDRTQAPSGIGYALENRMTMLKVVPDLFDGMNVKPLAPFFESFNKLLLEASPRKTDSPNVVILTPGPHNETYFEHAYLSSQLGFPLVQGNDLVVRNDCLWMKSLNGLKRVDVILRRVDDLYTDPLELKEDSHLGVPGLLEIVRNKNVAILNPIGSRILENPGLTPFMPNIAKYFLNQELILPQIASWWCGQENEKQFVLKNLSKFTIRRIDRSDNLNVFHSDEKSTEEIASLAQEIAERPYRFVATEKIGYSSTPTFTKNKFQPEKMVWRTFAIANKKSYEIMPGGLVRLADNSQATQFIQPSGGHSKDIWILAEQKTNSFQYFVPPRNAQSNIIRIDELPSQTAENLFWAGRYVGRSLTTARFFRTILSQVSLASYNEEDPLKKNHRALFEALTTMTSSFPGFFNETTLKDPLKEIYSLILDKNRSGSLSQTLFMFTNSYYSIRNLWSADMWRVFERIENKWKDLQDDEDLTPRKIIHALDQLITRLIAFMGLIEESILLDQGLLMYYIGLQLEQSMLTISQWRSLLTFSKGENVEYEIMESLLSSYESLNIYRHSYRSFIELENVIELMLLDLKYPRSLAFRIQRLHKDLSKLPYKTRGSELSEVAKHSFKALSIIRMSNRQALTLTNDKNLMREQLENTLKEISESLMASGIALTNNYFSHTYKQNQLVIQKLSD